MPSAQLSLPGEVSLRGKGRAVYVDNYLRERRKGAKKGGAVIGLESYQFELLNFINSAHFSPSKWANSAWFKGSVRPF